MPITWASSPSSHMGWTSSTLPVHVQAQPPGTPPQPYFWVSMTTASLRSVRLWETGGLAGLSVQECGGGTVAVCYLAQPVCVS